MRNFLLPVMKLVMYGTLLPLMVTILLVLTTLGTELLGIHLVVLSTLALG